LPNQIDGQINAEYVYFDKLSDFVSVLPQTSGQRLHIQPRVSYPLITPSSFFTPQLQLDATFYNLEQTDSLPEHSNRLLPIFDVDTGLYFERSYGCYTQTLEPRLFYLYVPNKNQNDIPVFDTTIPFFNFDQLFRTNRFVGYDRLGDANQLSFALTTRFLESCTGRQKIRLSLGQLLYFAPPNVSLTPIYDKDFYVNQTLSPLVAEINYNFSPVLDGVADIALSPDDHGLNNASAQLHYHPDRKHIFNIGYDFVRKGDTLTTYALNSSQNNLNRINLATAWQITDHWQALGNWNYNLSHGHPEAYFYGLQYDSCCWALRIVASRIITAENVNDQATFQNNYYVQLQLKGLGNLGNSDPGNLLTSSILGYQDTFRS
jgi:LPS-assembly protein